MHLSSLDNHGPSRRHTPATIAMRPFVIGALILMVVGFFALMFDTGIAKALREGVLPGEVRNLVALAEVFAHGLGVIAILFLVWAIAIEHRRRILRVAACAFVPGIAVVMTKTLIARDRPSALTTIPDNFSETFHGIIPAVTQSDFGLLFERNLQSCPSGHSATAVGLAIGLTWLLPRGKWCFAVFAILAMCQRMQSGAHFTSDTLFAAAIATLIAGYIVADTRLSRRISQFEEKQHLKVADQQRDAA